METFERLLNMYRVEARLHYGLLWKTNLECWFPFEKTDRGVYLFGAFLRR